jgi:molybdopterin converting factor subunit 1
MSRMPVRILYFAGLRDAVGHAEETVELRAIGARPPTVRGLADYLAARHPAYAARRDHVRIARNEVFAAEDEPVVDGDVIALIPPVAGG